VPFPAGRPDGTVTEKIADYFQRVLLPMADVVLDFQSGGKTLDFLPFCAAHILPDKSQETRAFELVRAFGAPHSVKMLEIDALGMCDTDVEEALHSFRKGCASTSSRAFGLKTLEWRSQGRLWWARLATSSSAMAHAGSLWSIRNQGDASLLAG
jgi:predicted deacylase